MTIYNKFFTPRKTFFSNCIHETKTLGDFCRGFNFVLFHHSKRFFVFLVKEWGLQVFVQKLYFFSRLKPQLYSNFVELRFFGQQKNMHDLFPKRWITEEQIIGPTRDWSSPQLFANNASSIFAESREIIVLPFDTLVFPERDKFCSHFFLKKKMKKSWSHQNILRSNISF